MKRSTLKLFREYMAAYEVYLRAVDRLVPLKRAIEATDFDADRRRMHEEALCVRLAEEKRCTSES